MLMINKMFFPFFFEEIFYLLIVSMRGEITHRSALSSIGSIYDRFGMIRTKNSFASRWKQNSFFMIFSDEMKSFQFHSH